MPSISSASAGDGLARRTSALSRRNLSAWSANANPDAVENW
jgi:hypothetical protein